MSAGPLRLGVLGTGRIAREFCSGVSTSGRVRVEAVASRDATRAQAFAAALGIGRAMGSYEALLADAGLDAVYIALPNSLHGPWTLRALAAGKHVLCEKPLAVDAREAREVFAAAHAQGRCLAEAYPYRTQPQTLALRDLLRSGTLGHVRFIQAHFSFQLESADDIRLQPELAGGALMDVGCYCVSLVRMVAQGLPRRITATAQWTGVPGVDRALAATLEFPDGLIAQVTCGLDAALERHALIVGTDGVVRTTFFNHPPSDGPAELLLRPGRERREPWRSIAVPAMNGFRTEAEAFELMVRRGEAHWSGASAGESIDTARMMETMLESARSGRAVELPP